MALRFERIGTESHQQPMAMIAKNVMGEDPAWIVDPPFQRGSVWTARQKTAWIDTLLRGLGIPAIIINRFPKEHPVYGYKEVVIDGQQRLRATAGFMEDQFKVRGERWSEQSRAFQRSFYMTQSICSVVYCGFKTDRECAELYLKLLQAGTSHTSSELAKARRYLKKVS